MKGLLIMQALRPSGSGALHLKAVSRAALLLFIIYLIATVSTARAQNTGTTKTTTDIQPDVITQQAEKPQPTPETPAKSIVRGRVIYEDTNRPVRRARVLLLKSDASGGMEKGGATNERGEFQIKDVAAGTYFVMVDAPGIITPLSSVELEENMNERAAFIAIKKEFEEISVNGTNKVDVQIRARRGGVVTGRVTYQDGDPAINAQVIILRKKDNRLIRFITGFSPLTVIGFRTDDRGVYRIAGLPPGEYVLGAAETNTREDARDEYSMMGLSGSSNFNVSYYQNETSLRQATAVKVEAGQEASEINVTLIDRALYTVSGTVVARQGRTPLRAQVSIQSKSESNALSLMDSSPSTTTDEQGRWTFTGIPDGTYMIKADPGSDEAEAEDQEPLKEAQQQTREGRAATATSPRRPSFVPRQQDVTVSGADLSGVVIEVSEGGRLQGRVSVEGVDKQLPPGLNVYLLPREGGLAGLERYGFIEQDGSFTIYKVPPGEFYLSVPQLSDKFYVKSITAGGSDLMREPVRMSAGTSVENIRITIASDVATLRGRVVSSGDAKPVRAAILLLVPSDPARWRYSGSFLPVVTESDGTFKITAAPGPYLLMLLGEGENLRSLNEAFVKARSAGAKAVTLAPNGSETIELVAPAIAP